MRPSEQFSLAEVSAFSFRQCFDSQEGHPACKDIHQCQNSINYPQRLLVADPASAGVEGELEQTHQDTHSTRHVCLPRPSSTNSYSGSSQPAQPQQTQKTMPGPSLTSPLIRDPRLHRWQQALNQHDPTVESQVPVISCHQKSGLWLKIQKNQLWLGLCPKTQWTADSGCSRGCFGTAVRGMLDLVNYS